MNAAIYARYSSSEQAGTLTIESQLRACKEYALSKGMRLVGTYIDRGVSGTRDQSRPEFQGMIARARTKPRPFDAILVWKYSRFFRDRYKSAIYKGLLRQYGIEVISVTEPVERDTPSGLLMEGMIELIDQFYSARLAEETRRGLKENVLAGYRAGSVAPFGYQRQRVDGPGGRQKTIIKPDHETAPIVRRIFEQYAAGQAGLKKLARMLNEEAIPSARGGTWDPSAIRSILKNEVYLGWGVLGKRRYELGPGDRRAVTNPPQSRWVVNETAHEALIEIDLWESVQAQFERTRQPQMGMKTRVSYLMTGLLRCALCGGNFTTYKTRKRDGSWWHAYVCGMRKRRGRIVCDNSLEIPHEPFNARIVEWMIEMLAGGQYLDEIARRVNEKVSTLLDVSRPRLKEAKSELAMVIRRMSLCVDAVLDGGYGQIRDKMKQLQAREDALRAEIGQLEKASEYQGVEITKDQIRKAQIEIIRDLSRARPEALREQLRKYLQYIKVSPSGDLEFHFKPEGLFPASAVLHNGWYTASGFILCANLRSIATA
jgi:site-specific DNA recombinase